MSRPNKSSGTHNHQPVCSKTFASYYKFSFTTWENLQSFNHSQSANSFKTIQNTIKKIFLEQMKMEAFHTPSRLEGKVAIITGGASGFGESTARLFARHGAKVVVADVQDDLGHSLCTNINLPDQISYLHCDVTNDAEVRNAVDFAVKKYGGLDIMFNNAGIPGALDFAIADADNDNFKRVFEVNVYGSFLGAKHAARVMIPARKGVILFTSSIASVVAGESPHSYTMSKHAVVGLMRNLCVELGQYGIRVNSISPCAVATPLLTGTMGVEREVVEDIICTSANLKGVVPTADDVAEAALYLSSEESKFVSGLNLVVDGGYSTTNQSYSRVIKSVFSPKCS